MPDVVEALEMLQILYGAVNGELRVQDEQLAVIGPCVRVVICGIVRDLNKRERPSGERETERLDPAMPGTVSPSSDSDPTNGCGLKRLHDRFSDIN